MSEQQHAGQPTLRDLLRPIVAHKWLLVGVIALAVAASLAYSKTRKVSYTATAAITIHGDNQALSLVGLPITPIETADQQAAGAAQTIVQPSVGARVKRALHSREPASALTAAVNATVQPSSNLVEITAKAPTAPRAARLANAFAAAGADTLNVQGRRVYANALGQLRKRKPKHTNPATPAEVTAQEVYSQQVSRLQTLSAIANPAQIVSSAAVPGAPSSPRPLRDGLLAGGLGLVLGLILVYVLESFDRRLRTVHDVERELDLPMLGHVRHDALGQSPRVNGNGGISNADWELFRIMRRNLDFLDQRREARVVAVTSALPEEGKSTVAAFLALVSAAAGKRTLLVECDLRRPVLAERLGIEEAPGLSDFLAGRAGPGQILQVVRFGDPLSPNGAAPRAAPPNGGASGASEPGDATHGHQLVCITAGTATRHPVELLRSDRFREMLEEVGKAYDLVVLDTSPMLSVVDTLELLPEVDAALVCVRVYRTTRQQAKAGMAALARLPERPTGVVITGTRPAGDAEYGYYGYYS